MRTYHTVTRQVLGEESCACDLCGSSMESYNPESKVEINAQRGTRYPAEFVGEKFGDDHNRAGHTPDIDICMACFETKVIPALRAIGLPERIRWRRYSY
jgi:hypothetical protein